MKCIVCHSQNIKSFGIFDFKHYWKCDFCEAKFLDKCHFLQRTDEKKHYSNHKNCVNDLAYRSFLEKLKEPLKRLLLRGDVGLDYGCGKGPALADMFRQDGFEIELYDPFFFPNKTIFNKKYDFITCTETVEHFHDPFHEFIKIDGLLKASGKLGLMTCFSTADDAFENWHYRRDPTHVVFYKESTFEVISSQRRWVCDFPLKDIVLISKA